MDESKFHAVANATLLHCFDQLEDAFEASAIEELDMQNGILTIVTLKGDIFLLSKHGPTRQLWLASPISGGLHFSYDEAGQYWKIPTGEPLYELLRRELATHHITVVL